MEAMAMFGTGWCGQMGIGSWLVMAALWGSLIALVAWAITRIFPTAPAAGGPSGHTRSDLSADRSAIEFSGRPPSDPRLSTDADPPAAPSRTPTRAH
jgi:hypothetical protein